MNVGLYAAQIQAALVRERETQEQTYEKYPDTFLFWCFMDLVDSSNYRIVKGPRAGYMRGETFLSLVSSVVEPCADVRIIKELGDGVLLASEHFRHLLESALLVDQTAHQMASVAGDEHWPFRVRTGLGYGLAKRLARPQEDFLGSSIDRLARLMSIRAVESNIVIDNEAYNAAGEIVQEYERCVEVSAPIALDPALSKGMLRDVLYRTLQVNRPNLLDFREHFVPWREALGRVGGERQGY